MTAKEGTTIAVVVSAGPPPVAIPNDMTSFSNCNRSHTGARGRSTWSGCARPSAAQYSSTVVAGAVLGTAPTGTALYGSTVTIVTSKGHAPVAVPAVNGAGIELRHGRPPRSAPPGSSRPRARTTAPASRPARSSAPRPIPRPGPQPFGSTVTVVVSLGPQPVTIPASVVGESVGKATSDLQALGLKVAGPYGPPGANQGALDRSRRPGTSVPPGTTVNLYTL